jgi:type II secretory pathway pseudopilin PulG
MLSRRPHTGCLRASDERGFTLIELLVAVTMGMVVCLALFSILDFATKQEARITDVADANQLGRTAMTKLVDELHSACISAEFRPILEKSSETELWFVNAYSKEAIIESEQAFRHDIVWNEKNETLTDKIYASTGGSWPNFTFPLTTSTPTKTVLLASKVSQSEAGGKKLPIFQYYAYTTKGTSGGEAGLSTLSTEALKVPLTEKTAPTAAAVLIRFNTSPSENVSKVHNGGDLSASLSDQVTLAFSAPHSESTTVDGPCQ